MAQQVKETKENFRHIVRIANVDLPGNKQIRFALTKIKGIGINFADALCQVNGIKRTAKAGTLTEEEIKKLDDTLKNLDKAPLPHWLFNRRKDYETGEDRHLIGGELTFVQENDIKRSKKIKCYRGVRHQLGLPVRGQRTKSNFRKNKGKVVGVMRKKVQRKR